MKKLQSSLLLVAASTLIIAGCQKPAPAPADNTDVSGSIKIEKADNSTQDVTGSVSIVAPKETEVAGSVSIVPATESDEAMDTATKAMDSVKEPL